MYSAFRSTLAAALLFVSTLCEPVASSQAVKFIRHAADPLPFAGRSAVPAPCRRGTGSATADSNAAGTNGEADVPCDTAPVSMPAVNPCNFASTPQIGCSAPRDSAPGELAALGKTGQKILRARDRVLEILQTENACSSWFREKDSNPAATFRTVSFEVDSKGEEFIMEFKQPDSLRIFHDPYIAMVGQDAGAYTAITINANGAFFRSAARVVAADGEGGPFTMLASRYTNVGLYTGGSLSAQILTLLHEFGHVIDLLPTDLHDLDGKSVRNTQEVLRNCRSAIESKPRRSALSASR